MNYIKEINSFYDWLETNSVSDSAINLWHGLLHVNNKASNNAGWKEEFTVAISTLMVKTSLSKSSIIRARNQLKQLGRIDFKERKGNQSCIYKILSFHTDTQSKTQSATQSVTQAETQSDTQTDTINKLNKTKQNIILLEKESKEENITKEILQENSESLNTGNKPSKKVAQKKVSENDHLEMPEDFVPIWEEWHQYRKAKRIKAYAGTKWEQIAVDKLLELSDRDPVTAKLILKQTYESNYQGFFPLKPNFNGQSNNSNSNSRFTKTTTTGSHTISGKTSATTAIARHLAKITAGNSESGDLTTDAEIV